MIIKKILPIILAVAFILFPFLIHYGLRHYDPVVFSLLLFLLLVPRTLLTPSENKSGKVIMLVAITVYCGAIAVFDSEQLLRYYPVLISLYAALLFFLSLFDKQPLIETFAQMSGKPYPDGARRYMRTLTKLWVLLLVANASVAAYSACCASSDFWLIYNGFISYAIILGFIAAEVVFRQCYRRKYFPDFD